jgi:hypothetical protein
MSVADAKRALAACEDGVKIIQATQKSNQVLIDDYNNRHKEWEAKKNASNTTWEANNKARQDAQTAWDRKKQDFFNGNQESKWWNNCSPTWEADSGKHDDWCRNDFGDGWYHSGKVCGQDPCGFWNQGSCKGICSKTDNKRWNEATQSTIREKGNRPDNYNDPRFSDSEPRTPEQNKTSFSLACCSNITNVIGSDITDATIKQQNDCLSSKQSAVTAAEKAEADAKAKAIADANAKASADAKAADDAKAAKAAADAKIIADARAAADAKAASDRAAADAAVAALAAANAKAAVDTAKAKQITDTKAVTAAAAASAADQTYMLMFVVLIIFLILFSIVMLIL